MLLSGSDFGKRSNGGSEADILVRGKLLAGTPDRPLTADCHLRISGPWIYTDHRGQHQHGQYGLLVREEGALHVYSADQQRARLQFHWTLADRNPGQNHIHFTFLGDVRLNGAVFNDTAIGGIKVASPAMRGSWRNIFFGSNNQGPEAELFQVFTGTVDKIGVQHVGKQ